MGTGRRDRKLKESETRYTTGLMEIGYFECTGK